MTSVFKIRHIPSGRFAKKCNSDPFNISAWGEQAPTDLVYTRKAPAGDVWNSHKIAEKCKQDIPRCYRDFGKMVYSNTKTYVPLEDLEVVEFELVEKK